MHNEKNIFDDRAYDILLKQFDVLHRSLDARITTRTQLYVILFSLVAVGLIGSSSEYIDRKISDTLMEFITQNYFFIGICIGFCVISIQTEIINLTLALYNIQKSLNLPLQKCASHYNILHSFFMPLPNEFESTKIYNVAIKLCVIPIASFIAIFLGQKHLPEYSNIIGFLNIIAMVNLLNSIIFILCLHKRKRDFSLSLRKSL
ncbi:membrane hypothetical protein [uncultured Sporomusa sp.]|uniref:Uncharacterized protein n=1 Tax=uncultured Sporomusa sp. TaxID=307249 RepID=A0A212LTV1_9FIRM|nr:hypothetical protein [uncultured Sporomusa sp.]SCM81005.1 membrane hypothetical protein [uncultured Sporomusa sp.]